MTTTTESTSLGIKPYLSTKRAELIWALLEQGYNETDVASVFNVSKQRINTIKKQMPPQWQSPWIKIK